MTSRARQALRDFLANAERIMRRNSQNANWYNGPAWVLAEAGLALDAAFRYARQAVKLAPENADILDTMAQVHFRRGEYMKALAIERPSAEKNPERADLKKQLEMFERAAKRK